LNSKNQQWWQEFGAACKKVNPNVYLTGEVWEKPSVIAPFFK
jgi:alpha-amylase